MDRTDTTAMPTSCPPEASRSRGGRVLLWAILLLVPAIALGVGIFAWGRHARQIAGDGGLAGGAAHAESDGAATDAAADSGGEDGSASGATIVVKTIHPQRNPHELIRSVTQPAFVEGLFTADLMAQVAGTVKFIQKNIGDPIQKGELLVELAVPDLVQDLAQKSALIAQAEQDAKAAEIAVDVAAASAHTAATLIKEKEADAAGAAALNKFHEEEYARFKTLTDRHAVTGGVLDEKRRNWEASIADLKTAQIAIETARARAAEFSAKLAAARVDVEVKRQRIAVAKVDQARTQAMLNYAEIKAPFDGLIVARNVDPGSFVQNASTGKPAPILRVVRTDWVTIVTWVPEKEAPLVSKQSEALIRLDALGDREFRTKVTRFSHWLDPEKGRDMRVEVDIDNHDGKLSPGMYGSMKLILQRFDKAWVVPTSAIFASGAQTCIFEVRGGKALRVPVRVVFEDGVQAKIVKLVRQTDAKSGRTEIVEQELAGNDEIVQSGQGELADGQPVKTVAMDR